MKEEYRYIDSKVVAYDDKKGLQVYEYQDNIEDILKQENTIELLEDILKNLQNEKKFTKIDNSFFDMLHSVGYGDNIFIMYIIACLMCCSGMAISMNNLPGLPLITAGFGTMVGTIPMMFYYYKKYKKDTIIKVENIEQQIIEFEAILQIEKAKLNNLKNDKQKKFEKDLYSQKVKIDNNSIEAINLIQDRKRLYEFFRDNLKKIKKLSDKGKLDSLFDNIEDSNSIGEMCEKNKVLKKHN